MPVPLMWMRQPLTSNGVRLNLSSALMLEPLSSSHSATLHEPSLAARCLWDGPRHLRSTPPASMLLQHSAAVGLHASMCTAYIAWLTMASACRSRSRWGRRPAAAGDNIGRYIAEQALQCWLQSGLTTWHGTHPPHLEVPEPHDALTPPQVADAGKEQQLCYGSPPCRLHTGEEAVTTTTFCCSVIGA